MRRALPLFVLTIICIALISFFAVKTLKHTGSTKQTYHSVVLPPVTQLKLAAISFYSTYTACLKTQSGSTQINAQTCKSHNIYVSKSLSLAQITDTDPLTCATTEPLGYSVKKVTSNPEGQVVEVVEQLPSSSQTVNLTFHREEGIWKISNIVCPSS